MRHSALALLLGPICLAGCAPGVITEIGMSDIVTVAEKEQPRVAKAWLRVPQPEDRCRDKLAALGAALAKVAPVPGNGRCVADPSDGTTYAEIPVTATIIPAQSERPDEGGFIIEVYASHGTRGRIYDLTFVAQRRYDEFVATALAATGDKIDPTRKTVWPEIHVRIVNDTAYPLAGQFEQVFLEERPVMPDECIPVAAGSAIDLTLSNVAAATIGQGNGHIFAHLALTD